jgi:hypothetical protein
MLDAGHAHTDRFDVVLAAQHPYRDAGHVIALHRVANECLERAVHGSRC